MTDQPVGMAEEVGRTLERADAALIDLAETLALNDPLAAFVHRMSRWLGVPRDAEALLDYWLSRSPGSGVGPQRYRWELTHARGVELPSYADPPERWRAWRPLEQPLLDRDPFRFEEHFMLPVVLCHNYELLCRLADDESTRSRARQILLEVEPLLRRDFAAHLQSRHAWSDTFAFSILAESEGMLAALHPFALAMASSFAQVARQRDGLLRGTRFPFHEKLMVSINAQLAAGLLSLGEQLDVVASIIELVRGQVGQDGLWADADQPPDLMASLVCAKLLLRCDPSFDVGSTLTSVASRQRGGGLWRVLSPEVPWLSWELRQLFAAYDQPFSRRFCWPYLSVGKRDRKTDLPSFGYFSDLALLFSQVEGLASSPTQLVFIDLARFREFNNRFGQDMGDAVLREFAAHIEAIAGARVIRDGGDEFLIVGAPTRDQLERDLDQSRQAWPERFAAAFGDDVPTVAPRILVGSCAGRDLISLRERLGRDIGSLKGAVEEMPPSGLLRSC